MNNILKNILHNGLSILDTCLPRKKHLSILIYHSVLPRPDAMRPNEITASQFDRHMQFISQNYNVISLRDAIQRLKADSLKQNALVITFDDGYADNAEIALPILKKHGLSATFFISTGFLHGKYMWNDLIIESIRTMESKVLDLRDISLGMHQTDSVSEKKRAADTLIGVLKYQTPESRKINIDHLIRLTGFSAHRPLMMSPEQVRQLHDAGMIVGAHTVMHPILSTLDVTEAENEIRKSKTDLEAIIGSEVDLFAYPNGRPGLDYLAEHVQLVKRLGFIGAVSTADGVSTTDSDLYQLARFTPWDKDELMFSLRLLKNSFKIKH